MELSLKLMVCKFLISLMIDPYENIYKNYHLVNWGNEICLKWASLNNQMLFKPYPTYFYGISKFLGKWNSDL